MPTSGPWPPYSAAGQCLRRNLQKESSVNVLDLPDLARRIAPSRQSLPRRIWPQRCDKINNMHVRVSFYKYKRIRLSYAAFSSSVLFKISAVNKYINTSKQQ